MTNGSLMKVKCIAECSKGSILQYFWPALSDIWSWNQFMVFLRVTVLHRFYCIWRSIAILFISPQKLLCYPLEEPQQGASNENHKDYCHIEKCCNFSRIEKSHVYSYLYVEIFVHECRILLYEYIQILNKTIIITIWYLLRINKTASAQ